MISIRILSNYWSQYHLFLFLFCIVEFYFLCYVCECCNFILLVRIITTLFILAKNPFLFPHWLPNPVSNLSSSPLLCVKISATYSSWIFCFGFLALIKLAERQWRSWCYKEKAASYPQRKINSNQSCGLGGWLVYFERMHMLYSIIPPKQNIRIGPVGWVVGLFVLKECTCYSIIPQSKVNSNQTCGLGGWLVCFERMHMLYSIIPQSKKSIRIQSRKSPLYNSGPPLIKLCRRSRSLPPPFLTEPGIFPPRPTMTRLSSIFSSPVRNNNIAFLKRPKSWVLLMIIHCYGQKMLLSPPLK